MSIGQDFAKHNRGLATHLEDISKAFDEIEPVFRVLALGLEYREYVRFTRITPGISHMADGSRIVYGPRRLPSETKLQLAIDITMGAALRYAEIDPDPQPARGSKSGFSSSIAFRLAVTDKARHAERLIEGVSVEIRGGFEARSMRDGILSHPWPGGDRAIREDSLDRHRAQLIEDRARELAIPQRE